MGKKVNKSTKKEQEPVVVAKKSKKDKKVSKEEVKQIEEPVEEVILESETIEAKKATTKLYKKTLKKLDAELKEKLDRKLVTMAVDQLQEFNKREQEKQKNKLLDDDEDFIYASFTLTELPKKFSPKPHLLSL